MMKDDIELYKEGNSEMEDGIDRRDWRQLLPNTHDSQSFWWMATRVASLGGCGRRGDGPMTR